jgi:actin-like ATPase involved in cell morphogenesis
VRFSKLYLKLTKLAADIYNTGFIFGGGSMLRGLDKESLKKQTYQFIAEDPLKQ